jgi:hypothetical protein
MYEGTFVGLLPASATYFKGNTNVTGFNVIKFSKSLKIRAQQTVNSPRLSPEGSSFDACVVAFPFC